MNGDLLETIIAKELRVKISDLDSLAMQSKFVSARCHAHSNADKPHKTTATTFEAVGV